MAVDALGNPLRVILSAGQIADIDCAAPLIKNLPSQAVVADKGYDADHFVAKIEAAGAEAVIPPRSNRLTPREFCSLLEYSASLPTGTTPGKRWKRLDGVHDRLCKDPCWVVGEYGKPEGNSVPIHWYRPVISIRAATQEVPLNG